MYRKFQKKLLKSLFYDAFFVCYKDFPLKKERKNYCIFFLLNIYILISFRIFFSNFKSIIEDLQYKAEKVFREEQAAKPQPLLQYRNTFYPGGTFDSVHTANQ